MKKAKALAKKMGFTFNDLIMGLVSKSIKEYFMKQGDGTSYVSLALPFSFKQIPKNPKDFKSGNTFSTLTLYLPLESEINAACQKAK